MKFIDLFAGIGGFRRGMELAGHECVGFCEFDKYAVASYTAMHLLTDEQLERINNMPVQLKKNGDPNLRLRQNEIWKEEYKNGEWYANDIRSVDAGSMPRADCWCFGFPCQDISIAGNCAGFSGHRSSLFFAVTKLIRDLKEEDRPKYLFIENVKNLLSINRGFDFARLLVELDEIGYDAEWALLNSKDFGVPQNRERVFIVGHLRGRGGRKVFPLEESISVHNTPGAAGEVYEIAQCITAGGHDKWQGDYIVKQIGNCMPTVTRDNPNQGRIYDTNGIAPCLNKMDGGGRVPLISKPFTLTSRQAEINSKSHVSRMAIPVITSNRINKRQNGRRFKNDGDPMFTLTAQDRHGVAIYQKPRGNNQGGLHETAPTMTGSRYEQNNMVVAGACDRMKIRRLIPLECFRLQAWVDEYFRRAALVNSESQLYKQAGNGVTVSVIYEIARRME